jgi:hypothetical protein
VHEVVYLLCAATSLLCAVLLARSYRQTRTRLLLWSTLCFAGMTINNALLVLDLVALPDLDLSFWRSASAFVALLLLVIGLIWEVRS